MDHAIRIEGLVIPATGDLFTGEIHAELKQTNESPLLASLVWWLGPVIAALEMLEREYGNVSVHARKLEDAGYISCHKGFEGRVPRTEYKLTAAGRKAMDRYFAHMTALIEAARGK